MSFKMKSIIIPLILIILSSSVFAFGVTDWLEGPVQVAPGGTGKVTFELQNMNGEEDMIASYEILQGADIVSIEGEKDITVPLGTKKIVNVLINVPKSYPIGNYLVEISFVSKNAEAEGPVKFGTGITKRFSVDVKDENIQEVRTEETPKKSKIPISSAIVILVIILIIIIIARFIGKKRI